MSERAPIEIDPGSVDVDLAGVKTKAVKGVVALTLRSFFVQIISFLATFLLTVFLDPKIYGIFFLVSAFVSFLTYFSDIGLAAALIQKKEKLTKQDLATTFTIQQTLVLVLLALLFVATPTIKAQYGLPQEGVYLMWALGASLFLSSLKTIPSVLLEKHLRFDRLVIPQIIENVVFNLVAVVCAWQGLGITSFTLAVLARGVTGLVAMYLISPWAPRFGLDLGSLKHLLKFGLPYQINTFLAVIKDDGMTIFLGRIISAEGLGFIGWANKWASLPLRFLMDNVTKVSFPTFALVQDDPQALKKGIEKTIFYLALTTFPILVGMGMLAQPLVEIIPRYGKWQPALIPLYLYLINSAFAVISTPLTNLLNATGRIKVTSALMVMWVVLTWLLMPLLGIRLGFVGISLAAALISLSSLVVFYLTHRFYRVDFVTSLAAPIIASTVMALPLYLVASYLDNIFLISFAVIASAIIYGLVVFVLEGKALFVDLVKLIKR